MQSIEHPRDPGNHLISRRYQPVLVVALPHVGVHHQVRRVRLDDLSCLGFADDMGKVCAEESARICAEEWRAGVVFASADDSDAALLAWGPSVSINAACVNTHIGERVPLCMRSSSGGMNLFTCLRRSRDGIVERESEVDIMALVCCWKREYLKAGADGG